MSFKLEAAGGPFHDPALLLTPLNRRESLLFDCGTLHSLNTKDLLRVHWLFLSHLHIDHLIGFDHLLRVRLFSELPLLVFGPPGTAVAIGHRLQGYAWNLTSGSPFEVRAVDLREGALQATLYRCHDRFEGQPDEFFTTTGRTLDLGQGLTATWHPVNHGVPCLCYRVEQTVPSKFSLETALRLGLKPGPWVKALVAGEEVSQIVDGVSRDQRWLADRLLLPRHKKSAGYLTDTRLDPALSESLADFFAGVDLLVCEAAYLKDEEKLAHENLHMTTVQAADLARRCQAGALLLFHLSRRHSAAGPERHLQEARSVFPRCELLSRWPTETPA